MLKKIKHSSYALEDVCNTLLCIDTLTDYKHYFIYIGI